MALLLGDHQFVSLKVLGVDAAGNREPALLDAPAVWTSSDLAVLTVESDTSDVTGATGIATATGVLGFVTVTATGTGVGGTVKLASTFDITVGAEAEVGFVLEAGVPEEKP